MLKRIFNPKIKHITIPRYFCKANPPKTQNQEYSIFNMLHLKTIKDKMNEINAVKVSHDEKEKLLNSKILKREFLNDFVSISLKYTSLIFSTTKLINKCTVY